MADKRYKGTDRLIIEHPKTGEAYGVTGAAFDREYAKLGFRAVSFEDGTPLKLSKDEEEAASRAAAADTANVGPAGIPPEPAPKAEKKTAPAKKPAKPAEPTPAPVPLEG